MHAAPCAVLPSIRLLLTGSSCMQTAGCTFTEDHAWMLQELQSPEEYSSYSVSSHGRLVAHCDTAAEMNNVRFAYLGLQEIHDWVAKFCAATQLDGQVSPDATAQALHLRWAQLSADALDPLMPQFVPRVSRQLHIQLSRACCTSSLACCSECHDAASALPSPMPQPPPPAG